MKNTFKKLIALLGPAVLTALGFAGCENGIIPGGLVRCEYGTPNCSFKLELTVTDEDGRALKDIRVIPAAGEYHGLDDKGYLMSLGKDTLITDVSGKASRTYSVMEVPNTFKVYFEDLDGENNGGTFAKDSADFASVKTGKGDNHWYYGEWTVSGTKKLKKQ